MKKFFVTLFLIFLLTQSCIAQEYKPAALKKHNEGVTYYDKRQYNNAMDCFLDAIKIDPNFIPSYYNLAVIHEYLGNNEKALASYKNILKLDMYNSEAAYKTALLSSKQGNNKVALTYLNLIPPNAPEYKAAQDLRSKLSSQVNKEERQYSIFTADSSQVFTQISTPTGIVKDGLGNIYAANFATNSITIINGNIKKCFFKGAPLSGPSGLAIDKYNNIYVACYNSGKVVLISQDGSNKILLDNLFKPYGLLIDDENNLYVSEQGRNSITKIKLY